MQSSKAEIFRSCKRNITNLETIDDMMEFENTVQAVKAEPELGKFQFRASNRWEMGGFNRTTIRGFYGAGKELGAEDRIF